MAQKVYKLKKEQQLDIDSFLERQNKTRELVGIEFNDEFDNVARNYKLIKLLYGEIKELKKRIELLERRNGSNN